MILHRPIPSDFTPAFRQSARGYSFREEASWRYGDFCRPIVDSYSVPVTSQDRHLLLCDVTGRPRVALAWCETRSGSVVITNLQRLRTRYSWHLGADLESPQRQRIYGYTWNRRLETRAQHQFRLELGGIHPNEFLLLEFIWRHREANRLGLCPVSEEFGGVNYRYLVEHYFTGAELEREMRTDCRLRVRFLPLSRGAPFLTLRFFPTAS